MLIRLIIGTIVLLWTIYCILVIGQLLNIWKITNEEIKIKKLLIPFYYLFKLKD